MTRRNLSLGGTRTVGRIGYGAMSLTGEKAWGDYPHRDDAIALLRAAVDLGVTLIDTADLYGPHANEMLIRDALHPYPENVVIATKGGLVRGGPKLSSIEAIGKPNYLRQCAHMSARRLGVERIDLYYLHSGWARDASFEDQVGTLAELQEQGLIEHIGLSNVTTGQLQVARDIVDIACVTAQYSVTSREQDELVDAVTGAGAVFSPWGPVASPTTWAAAETSTGGSGRTMDRIAVRCGATVGQIALAWLLQRSPAMMPIPGTTQLAHLRENLTAQDVELSPEDFDSISDILDSSSAAKHSTMTALTNKLSASADVP